MGGNLPPVGGGTNTKLPQSTQADVESFNNDAMNLSRQAMLAIDPQQKATLTAQSQILSNMAEDRQSVMSFNPIMDTLAKVQKFLGESQTLPLANSILGNFILPIPGAGAGVGAYIGEKEREMLSPGGLEAFLTPQNRMIGQGATMIDPQALKTAFTYGVLDLLLYGAGKLLHPIQTVAKLRGAAAEAETTGTENLATKIAGGSSGGARVINGDDIVSGVKDWANNVPASMRDQALKFSQDVEDKYAGNQLSIDDGLTEKTASWGRGYTNANIEGRPTVAAGEREVADQISKQLPETIAKYDKVLSMMYSIAKPLGKVIPTVARGALQALGMGGVYEAGHKAGLLP
jgi:hypothetical protein